MASTKVLLETSDKETFSVDKEVTERSVMLKNMLEGQSSLPRWTRVTHPSSRPKLTQLALRSPSRSTPQTSEMRPTRRFPSLT